MHSRKSLRRCPSLIDEWFPWLEEAVEAAIAPASVEVLGGQLNPVQLVNKLNENSVITAAQSLLELTYHYSGKELPAIIIARLAKLTGGQEWHTGCWAEGHAECLGEFVGCHSR